MVAYRIAPIASITTKHAPNWRVPTIRISIIGLRRLASHGIMSTKAAALMSANVTMKVEENQSSTRPRSSTISSAPRKVATKTKPTTSNPPRSKSWRLCFWTAPAASRRSSAISAIAPTPTGPLMRKHQCQE